MRPGRLLLVLLTVVATLAPTGARADDRWVFYTSSRTSYSSPWFEGEHRVMIPFGCTRAPYYSPDSRCSNRQGFHHGIDVAMECGTFIHAGRDARVVSAASLGPAYGARPLRLRNTKQGWDVVIGHASRLYVREGQLVRRGWRIARAGDSGAPDGCHLHFERRSIGGGLSTAEHPVKLLGLWSRRR